MRYNLATRGVQCLRQSQLRAGPCVAGLRKLTTSRKPLEEERVPGYEPKAYYPAEIGERLNGKYELVSKLGWGTGSTVWLAKASSWAPWQNERYFALKITNSSPAVQAAAHRELKISDHIFSIQSTHPGRDYIRSVLDSFEVEGPAGKHLCMAFEPLRQPLWMLGAQGGNNGRLPPRKVKKVLPSILKCLDFLHTEANVIHTDLKGDHFMVPFESATVLEKYVARQQANPAPRLEGKGGRPLYESRPDFGRMKTDVNFVKITDFGLAVRGDVLTKPNHDIQPQAYAAPEVMLKAGWSYSADIWNLGMVMWELLADVNILSGFGPGSKQYSDNTRFAKMIRILGPPPQELLSKADPQAYAQFYNENGEFRYPELIPDETFNLSSLTPMLSGEDKELFIKFARRMLTWIPEERATAKELLADPWLRSSVVSERTTGFGTVEDTRLA